MKLDLLIKNGLVIDGIQNVCEPMDIGIYGGRIAYIGQSDESMTAAECVDARGCIVTPGLIDSHMHIFDGSGNGGAHADTTLLAAGATFGIDAGSAGTLNYKLFSQSVIHGSVSTVRAFLNISPAGMAHVFYYPENVDPKIIDEARIRLVVEDYPDEILGLKVRVSKNIVGEFCFEPLRKAIQIADKLGIKVMVHTTNPADRAEEILNLLRPGDIFAHVYHGEGDGILDENGTVKPAYRLARERGVIFDVANGNENYSLRVAKAAIDQGFLPDLISSDITRTATFAGLVRSLPYVMSLYLNLGMTVQQVIQCTTSNPARIFGVDHFAGTLKVGMPADISVLRHVTDRAMTFRDKTGDCICGSQALIPQMATKRGAIVFRQVDF